MNFFFLVLDLDVVFLVIVGVSAYVYCSLWERLDL